MNSIKVFPDYFSEQALDEINYWGKEIPFYVYRVGKYGDKETAFYNYYDEVVRGLKIVRNKDKSLEKYSKKIDSLSVSCYYDKEDIKDYFDVTLRESHPKRILLYGYTCSKYGVSSITKERKQDKNDSHIDWWLYCDVTPWVVFKEISSNE